MKKLVFLCLLPLLGATNESLAENALVREEIAAPAINRVAQVRDMLGNVEIVNNGVRGYQLQIIENAEAPANIEIVLEALAQVRDMLREIARGINAEAQAADH